MIIVVAIGIILMGFAGFLIIQGLKEYDEVRQDAAFLLSGFILLVGILMIVVPASVMYENQNSDLIRCINSHIESTEGSKNKDGVITKYKVKFDTGEIVEFETEIGLTKKGE